jgi:hypothetical protein
LLLPGRCDEYDAALAFDMVGRPVAQYGGSGWVWMTGSDRTEVWDSLRAAGLQVAPDRWPKDKREFASDQVEFIKVGIPAHVLTTSTPERTPSTRDDDVTTVDFTHLSAIVNTAARAVRIVADGEAPVWRAAPTPTSK